MIKNFHISEVLKGCLIYHISSQNMDKIKEEIIEEVNVSKQQSASLWEGEIRLQAGDQSEDILAPVRIFHKDDSKNGCRLFDWTSGKSHGINFPLELLLCFIGFSTVEAIKYPMNVLGGKLKPKLKNLKPFIKVFS